MISHRFRAYARTEESASIIRRPPEITDFPGHHYFRLGAYSPFVTCVRDMLIDRGAGPYYPLHPAPEWSNDDVVACSTFQQAQGWKIAVNNRCGIDSRTWQYLINGYGRDIPPPERDKYVLRHPSKGNLACTYPPEYPGPDAFGPGRSNISILLLRLRIISRGYAEEQRAHLETDEGLVRSQAWDEQLRAACTRFQLAMGWRGTRASGYPCEETWRKLWTR